MNSNKKCVKINHPNLQPGFGCCQCRTFNGDQRVECKNCKHPRCDSDNKDLDKYNLN
jgi:hypothetical protein